MFILNHTNFYSDGLRSVVQTDGWRGLFKGTALGLVGVSNGAIQFTLYEQMKQWGFARKRRALEVSGKPWTPEVDKLVRS